MQAKIYQERIQAKVKEKKQEKCGKLYRTHAQKKYKKNLYLKRFEEDDEEQ